MDEVTDTKMVLTRYMGPMGFYHVDPNTGYLYRGDYLTYHFEKGDTRTPPEPEPEPEQYFHDGLVIGDWAVEKIMKDGVDVSSPQDRTQQYLHIEEDGTFNGRFLDYVYNNDPHTWDVIEDKVVITHATGLYPVLSTKVLTGDETRIVVEIPDSKGVLYTYHLTRK